MPTTNNPELTWALPATQTLAMAFHLPYSGIHPVINDGRPLADAYGLTKEERADFDHVSALNESLFHCTLSEFLEGGEDPFSPDASKSRLRWMSRVDAGKQQLADDTRAFAGSGMLASALEQVLALATGSDRVAMLDQLGVGEGEALVVLRDLAPRETLGTLRQSLSNLHERLSDSAFVDLAVRYFRPIDDAFFRLPTSLRSASDLPGYLRRFVEKWREFAERAALDAGSRTVQLQIHEGKDVARQIALNLPELSGEFVESRPAPEIAADRPPTWLARLLVIHYPAAVARAAAFVVAATEAESRRRLAPST